MLDVKKPIIECRITDIIEEAADVRTFKFDRTFEDA
jgi:hypothetical protein